MNVLATFEAAVRLGSFTRAATEIGLSQASVSRQIRDLEQHFGLSLFKRGRYDVTPTEHALQLADTVRRSLSDIASVADRLRAAARGDETLTIFSDLALASTLVAPCIGAFQRLHPKVRIRVLTSAEPIERVYEGFDVGLQSGRWAEDAFSIEPVADDALFPVCAPSRSVELPKPCSAADIAKQPLLHLSQSGRPWTTWHDFLRAHGAVLPTLPRGPTFDSYAVLLDVAERGEGIALGWQRSVQTRLDSGRLVRIPGLHVALPAYICAYTPKRARPSALAASFVRLLVDSLASH